MSNQAKLTKNEREGLRSIAAGESPHHKTTKALKRKGLIAARGRALRLTAAGTKELEETLAPAVFAELRPPAPKDRLSRASWFIEQLEDMVRTCKRDEKEDLAHYEEAVDERDCAKYLARVETHKRYGRIAKRILDGLTFTEDLGRRIARLPRG